MPGLWAVHGWPGEAGPLWPGSGSQREPYQRGSGAHYKPGEGHCQCKFSLFLFHRLEIWISVGVWEEESLVFPTLTLLHRRPWGSFCLGACDSLTVSSDHCCLHLLCSGCSSDTCRPRAVWPEFMCEYPVSVIHRPLILRRIGTTRCWTTTRWNCWIWALTSAWRWSHRWKSHICILINSFFQSVLLILTSVSPPPAPCVWRTGV